MGTRKAKQFKPYMDYDRQSNVLRVVWGSGTPAVIKVENEHFMTLLKSLETGEIIGVELWAIRQVFEKIGK